MTPHEPRYVFDTNALISAALFERSTPGRAFRWALRHGQVLTSPDTLDELVEVLGRDIPIQFVEVELEEAIRLSKQQDIYAYDAYMLSVAKRHRAPLLTLDGGLKEAARQTNVKLLEIDS